MSVLKKAKFKHDERMESIKNNLADCINEAVGFKKECYLDADAAPVIKSWLEDAGYGVTIEEGNQRDMKLFTITW